MKQDEHVTKVKFAWAKTKDHRTGCELKEVFAIFPGAIENPRFEMTFTPYEGHGPAHVDYLAECEPAKPEDYQWLKSFLEKNYGYKF